jgi:hypothetical protein
MYNANGSALCLCRGKIIGSILMFIFAGRKQKTGFTRKYGGNRQTAKLMRLYGQ